MTATDPALTALAQGWCALSLLHGRIEGHIERALQAKHDLSAREYSLLDVLSRQHDGEGGHLQMKQVADAVVLSQSATTRLVTRLEDRGLLARYLCPTDRRGIYTTSPRGRACWKRPAPPMTPPCARPSTRHPPKRNSRPSSRPSSSSRGPSRSPERAVAVLLLGPVPRGGRGWGHAEPPGPRDVPLPPPARRQPGRLVALVGRGVRGGAQARGARAAVASGTQRCHWCHVMAHESFEDAETAAYLNAHFVNVKVDREERPDVDAVYMEAVQAATGQGGWPMTVFLTPDAEPFYFGTYFPPAPPARHALVPAGAGGGRAPPGPTGATRSREVAGKIVRDLAGRTGIALGSGAPQPPGEEELAAGAAGADPGIRRAARRIRRGAEVPAVHGRWSSCCATTPAPAPRARCRWLQATCEAMARGGIYDQLGGGFARYSVDREWVVPHFEKMLYDNALLCRVYAHLWRATGSRPRAPGRPGDRRLHGPGAAHRPRAGSPPRWTPTATTAPAGTSRARTTCGRRSSCARCWARRTPSWPPRYFGVTEEGTFEEGASVLQLPDGRAPGRRRPDRLRTGAAARRAGAAAAARPGRQGRRRLERAGHRRARRDRRLLRPPRPGRGRHRGRRPARPAAHGRRRHGSPAPRKDGARRAPTPGCWRTTPMSPRASSRWPRSPARACGWSSPGFLLDIVLRPVRRRGRRAVRHRRTTPSS